MGVSESLIVPKNNFTGEDFVRQVTPDKNTTAIAILTTLANMGKAALLRSLNDLLR